MNNTLTYPGLTNSITAAQQPASGTITVTMTGAASEELRILTDDERPLVRYGGETRTTGGGA